MNSLLDASVYFLKLNQDDSFCGKLNEKVKNLLGFSNRLPEDKFFFRQLNEAIKFWNQLSEEEKQEPLKRFVIESVCKNIYEFFDSRVKNNRR